MLFAEEFGPVAITTIATSVLVAIGGLITTIWNLLRTGKKEDKEDARKDEETIMARMTALSERQKKQCDDDKRELNVRIDSLERRVERAEAINRKIGQAYAGEVARRKFAESLLKTNGIKVEAWDASTAELPSLDVDGETPKGS
jgi:hypothetical protein